MERTRTLGYGSDMDWRVPKGIVPRGNALVRRVACALLPLAGAGCGSPQSVAAAYEVGARAAIAVGAAAYGGRTNSGSPGGTSAHGPTAGPAGARDAVFHAIERCATLPDRVRLVVTEGDAHAPPRTPDGVRFVSFVGCRINWLDACQAPDGAVYTDAVKSVAVLGPRIVEVWDEVELYERLPGSSPEYIARARRGERLRFEVIADTVRETPAFYTRRDLGRVAECQTATHWVAAVEHGALRVNVDPPVDATETQLDAQKELERGAVAGCRRGEPRACDAVVAVTLTRIKSEP